LPPILCISAYRMHACASRGEMEAYAIANQKGVVGKTTVTLGLAVPWRERCLGPADRSRSRNAQIGGVLLHDARRAVRRIEAPTFVVHGAEDRLMPVAAGRRLARGDPRSPPPRPPRRQALLSHGEPSAQAQIADFLATEYHACNSGTATVISRTCGSLLLSCRERAWRVSASDARCRTTSGSALKTAASRPGSLRGGAGARHTDRVATRSSVSGVHGARPAQHRRGSRPPAVNLDDRARGARLAEGDHAAAVLVVELEP
jgi:hypothetical protein